MVFGRNDDFLTNGQVEIDYEVADISLDEIDDLQIECGLDLIDQVIWDGGVSFPAPDGAAMQLEPELTDANLNDLGENWCEAFEPFGAGDLGSPGLVNPPCP